MNITVRNIKISAFFLSLLLIITILLLFGSLYDTGDDLGNKCRIEGILNFSKPRSNLVFVKALLTEIIMFLPGLNLIGIAKYDLFQFLILTAIIYYLIFNILINKKSIINSIPLILIIFLAILPIIIRPQYTNTAGLVALVFVLFLINNQNSYSNYKFFLVSILLCFIGYGLRKEMFLTVLVMLVPLIMTDVLRKPYFEFAKIKRLFAFFLIIILSIGSLEFYEKKVGTELEIESRKNTLSSKFSKIFDYNYARKFRKPSNYDVFIKSGLSQNDLDLIEGGFFWKGIDTLFPRVEGSIRELTNRQSKMSRLITVKSSYQYLLTKELWVYTLGLIILLVFITIKVPLQQLLPYLFSFLLFLGVVFLYGWIQRYSFSRLFYAPLISLIVILLIQTRHFKGSTWLQGILIVLFSFNAIISINSHTRRLNDARDMTIKVHNAELLLDSIVVFGGQINFEYLYPPFPLKGTPPLPKFKVTSAVEAINRLNQESKEMILSDSLSLKSLNIFCQEHFNRNLKSRTINQDIGLYEVSMEPPSK
jgi:hypothetical protein